MNLKNMTRREIERKRDKFLKYLGYRNSAAEALRFRAGYDKCVEELIKRDLESILPTNRGT